ncbi:MULTISPECIES: hypothetical protein [unclassified Moorena]|uniref:hypothetical protein n=1 Tax=unclassified Moorena TaxID=2683338 RepID=UPI0014017436|nr:MULTISPECIES: hypothetical protein [unclassified Moorena]NEO15548.1 hypothetical protein [Moorena sp. SIO3E8]NEQ01961.1 hypothetical protein [Moorena sp. SIO3F7]
MSTISANPDLFVDLNQTDAETVSGGGFLSKIFGGRKREIFTVSNQTHVRLPYSVDGKQTSYPYPGVDVTWNTKKGGNIAFDYDFGRPGVQLRKYNLSNGGKYAFQLDRRTPYPYDIELFRIG